jgi:hypothetical protein
MTLADRAPRRYPGRTSITAAARATRDAMDPKPRPNHRLYLEILRSMTPEQRLLKAFELSEFSKALFIEGLRKRFPDATEEEFRRILFDRLEKCHNRNY